MPDFELPDPLAEPARVREALHLALGLLAAGATEKVKQILESLIVEPPVEVHDA